MSSPSSSSSSGGSIFDSNDEQDSGALTSIQDTARLGGTPQANGSDQHASTSNISLFRGILPPPDRNDEDPTAVNRRHLTEMAGQGLRPACHVGKPIGTNGPIVVIALCHPDCLTGLEVHQMTKYREQVDKDSMYLQGVTVDGTANDFGPIVRIAFEDVECTEFFSGFPSLESVLSAANSILSSTANGTTLPEYQRQHVIWVNRQCGHEF